MSKWMPEGLIKSLPGNTNEEVTGTLWPLGYEPRTSYPVPQRAGKWYRKARVAVRDETIPLRFASVEQEEYNRTHTACGRCRGRGYTRRDKNVGCHVCHGTGGVSV